MSPSWRQILIGLAALVATSPFVAPEVLAFPYHEDFGSDRVWSEVPIPRDVMASILHDANARVARSPLAARNEGRRIFLTDGGWRWRVLALNNHGSFALTRAAREDLIFNRSDVLAGTVENGSELGGFRTMAGVVAHEKCHGMERRHFGLTVVVTAPTWLLEGYCDYVAQESSLSDADVARLKAEGKSHPALAYYEGRRRVAAILAANGGNVDALFADY
ncbi:MULTISPECIES: hypothetical protein [unclassified Novosphingobium]|uniref:hypothetical protein n=1 Tax=unclassified Novosphingobium TaxID=2644732 RepID=UPI000EBD124D|nr:MULTISPECIES: hypothetical protein [unclassified Novosphingobium]HCF24582.1 hypothetical protein [Novosphingobium sp.]HQV03680.1 hypothetical protein [Novosphingobium sp.]